MARRLSRWGKYSVSAPLQIPLRQAGPTGQPLLQGCCWVRGTNGSPWSRQCLALAGRTDPGEGHGLGLRRKNAVQDPHQDCRQLQRSSSPSRSQVSGYRKVNRKWQPAPKLLPRGVINSFQGKVRRSRSAFNQRKWSCTELPNYSLNTMKINSMPTL